MTMPCQPGRTVPRQGRDSLDDGPSACADKLLPFERNSIKAGREDVNGT